MSTTATRAIVADAPPPDAQHPSWSLKTVHVAPPGPKQLLIRMVATGICHTDIVLTAVPDGALGINYPKIAGHEGAGYVEAVGAGVTVAAKGDPVLLSFDSCGGCRECGTQHPAYCDEFAPRNYIGNTEGFKVEDGGEGKVWGSFFGQSSFAERAVVSEASVVNVKDVIKSEEELKLFAPLGCGMQTGAGAVVNIAKSGKEDAVLVLGLGAVGLAAVMAAKIQGCGTVIAVDRVKSKVELAKTLGATHGLDASKEGYELTKDVKEIVPAGVQVAIDTTGAPPVIEAGTQCVAKRGHFMMIGVPPMDFEIKMSGIQIINTAVNLTGCIEGDSTPSKFVPQMIKWYREGKFPVDKLVAFRPYNDFEKALEELAKGDLIKPVLVY